MELEMPSDINEDKILSRAEITGVIYRLESFLKNKVIEVHSTLQSEKHAASEYYISDMKGYARGISHAMNWSLSFLKDKLLEE